MVLLVGTDDEVGAAVVELAALVVVLFVGCAATADAGLYPSGTALPLTGVTTSFSPT